MGPGFLRERFGKRFSRLVVLVLIISFVLALVPQNVLSVNIGTVVEAPLFTSIPSMTASATDLGTGATETGQTLPLDESKFAQAPEEFLDGTISIAYGNGEILDGAAQIVYLGSYDLSDNLILQPADSSIVAESPRIHMGGLGGNDLSLPVYAIKIKAGSSEAELAEVASRTGALMLGRVPGTNIYKLQCGTSDAEGLLAELLSSSIVEAVEQDRRYGSDRVSEWTQAAATALRSKLIEVSPTQDSYWEDIRAAQLEAGAIEQPVEATAPIEAPPAADAVFEQPAVTYSPETPADSAAVDQYATVTGSEETPALVEPAPVPATSEPVPTTSPATPTVALYDPTLYDPALSADAPDGNTGLMQDDTINVINPPLEKDGAAQTSYPMTPQIASVESEMVVPIRAVGSSTEPTEYAAPTGDVDVRFASSLAAATKLVDVSRGDKGFSIRVAGSSEEYASGLAAIVGESGIAYSDSDGAHILFTPTASGLSAQIAYAEGSANAISLGLPLFGLFAEQAEDGSVALIDLDNGKIVFTILASSSAGNGASTGDTKLSLATAADYNVSLLISNPGTYQGNLQLVTWSAAGSHIPVVGRIKVRYENDALSLEDAGLSLSIAGVGDGAVPQGYLASLGLKDGRINYGPLSSDRVRPVKFGEYTEFAGEAGFASLRIKPISYGVEQEIVLNAVPASNRFVLPLLLNSLSLMSIPSGNLDVIDASGNIVATIDADLMYDSRPASEGGPARSDLVQLELVELADGTKKLVITADADWLNDPARVYPVFIDPTTTTQYPGASTILPSSTPSFFWSYSDPTYVQTDSFIQIATDAGHKVFNPDNTYSIVYDHLIYTSSGLGAATRFTLPAANALQEGVYYWRSFVKNSNGEWACSNCNPNTDPYSSPAQVFYVNTTHVYSIYGQLPVKLPASATIDNYVTVPITVKNRGTAIWNATGSDFYALSYGITWTDGSGTHADRDSSIRTVLPYDLPPGQEVTLDARIKIPSGTLDATSITLNWDMVQNGICWFSDRGEHPFTKSASAQSGWNAYYLPNGTPTGWERIPTKVDSGGSLQLAIDITNAGTTEWNAMPPAANLMQVDARWIDASGNEVPLDNKTQLGSNMSPGAHRVFNLSITAPAIPGAYILKLDMWNDISHEWLSSQGVPTLDLPIMVSAFGIIPDLSYVKISDSMRLNPVSGNLVLGASDYASNGRGPPINITRTLNTLSDSTGSFGKGWSSALDTKLQVNADNSVTYFTPDGSELRFVQSQVISGYQTYVHPRGFFLTLQQKQSDEPTERIFQLVSQDQMLTYYFGAPSGGISLLQYVEDNNGNRTSYRHDDAQNPSRITAIDEAAAPTPATDSYLRRIKIYYNADGTVSYIRVPSSDSTRQYSFWKYEYVSGQLTSATFDPTVDPEGSYEGLAIPIDYSYSGTGAMLASVTTKYGASGSDSTVSLIYDASSRFSQLTDPLNAVTTVTYAASSDGLSVSVTNSASAKITYMLGRKLQIASSVATQNELIFEETFANGDLGNWTQVPINLASGKATSSSGYYHPDYGPHHIVDGSITESGAIDYWLPPDNQDVNSPAWVQVDLGASSVVTGVRFLPAHDGSTLKRATRSWHIAASNDGVVWTDVSRGTLPGAIKVSGAVSPPEWTEVKFSPSHMRYVRFYVDSYSGNGGGLNEMQVYGNPIGTSPTAAWTVGADPANVNEKVIQAAPYSTIDLGDEMLVSRDSYSDFSFESSVRMDSQRDVGIVFRVTNSKTDLSAGDGGIGGDTNANGNLGYYFFRASGESADDGKAVLWKRENGNWSQVGSASFTAPNLNQWYKLKVEAVGTTIKCYYDDTLLITVSDSSFTRGRVGLRAESTQNTNPLYYFGSATERPIGVYGKAYSSYSYDGEGNLAGTNQALSSTVNKYDDEVHGWSAQLPEQRFSIRKDASDPANNLLYADDFDAPNIIWTGDSSWTNYTVEAKIKILYAGAVDGYWPVGGNAGIVLRSCGDPEVGYYVGLAPNVTSNGVYLWRMQGLASNTLLKYGGTTPPVINQWVNLKVEVHGSHIKVYKDSVLAFEHDDAAIVNGKVGLRVATARAVFDDVKICGPDGSVWKYDDFQAKGDISSTFMTDKVSGLPSGESYLYDAFNRPYVKTDQNKRRTTVTRDGNGNIISSADSTGSITLYNYDSFGNLESQTAPMQATYNNVPNPSFEDTADWSVLPRGTTSTVTYDPTNAYQGNQSLKLSHNGTDDWIGAQSSFVPVKAGEEYTISAFVKSSPGFFQGTSQSDLLQHHHVYIRFWSSNNPSRSPSDYKGEFGAEIPAVPLGYDWQRIFKTVAVPSGATYADVLIALVCGQAQSSNVWVDGVQLETGATVPDFNIVKNGDVSNGTSNWSQGSSFPTGTSGAVGGSASSSNNWSSIPSEWGIDDGGEMGVYVWSGRNGTNESLIKTASIFGNEKAVTFQADIQMNEGRDAGLAFRIQENGDMYLLRCSGAEADKSTDATTNKTALWKRVGGLWTKVTTSDSSYAMDQVPAIGQWYTVEVTISGSDISWRYRIAGGDWSMTTFTAYDSQWFTGRLGLKVALDNGSTQASHHFDNVIISDGDQILYDDFSGQSVGWWQNTGSNWSALQDSGNWVLQGDGLAAARVTWKDVGLSDFTYEVKVKTVQTSATNATVGLVFRSDANTNAPDKYEYYFGIYPHSSQQAWKLWRVVNGNFGASPVASDNLSLSLNQYYTLKVRAEGGQIKLYIDGVEMTTYDDSNPYAYPCVGLRARNAKANFDDISLSGLGSAPSLGFTEGFDVNNPYLQQVHDTSALSSYWNQSLIDNPSFPQGNNKVIPGQNYTLSAKVYTAENGSGTGGARLRIIWKNASGNDLSGDECSAYIKTGGKWELQALTAVAPESAQSARIELEQANFQGETRFDDIRFERTLGQGAFSAVGNGSFETIYAPTGKPAGWSYDTLANWSLDTKIYKYGKSSVCVSTPTPVDSWAEQSVKVKPNTTYVFSAWIKTSAVAGSRGSGALLRVLSGGECYTSVPVTGNTDWNLQTIRFTTGPNVTSVLIGIQQGYGGPSSGTSWFDGIQLVEKSSWQSSYTYDSAQNFVVSTASPTGVVSTVTRDTAGQVTFSYEKQRAANGAISDIMTTYVHDNAGRVLQKKLPDPATYGLSTITTIYTYDKSGHKLSETDALGKTSTVTYDAAGHKLTEESPHPQIFSDDYSSGLNCWTPYNGSWGLDSTFLAYQGSSSASAVSLRGDGQLSNYSFSAKVKFSATGNGNAGILVRSDGATDNLDKNQYYLGIYPNASNSMWKLIKWANGVPTELTSGQINFVANQDYQLKLQIVGNTITGSVDTANLSNTDTSIVAGKAGLRVENITAIFDDAVAIEAGNTTYAYDSAGRLSSTSVSLGDNISQTTYVTDGMGHVTSKTTGGITVKASYDEIGNKLTETDAMGSVSRYVYDAQGVCSSFDRLGNLTSTIRAIDQDNLSESSAIDAAGYMEIDKSNASGVIATIDKRNNTVNNTYSAASSLASRVDAAYSPWLFAYDVSGRPGDYQDPFGGEIRFAYDSLGRLVVRTDARGLTQRYTFDNLGRTLTRTDSAGAASYTWDVLGRMSTASNAGGGTYMSYSYDDAGKLAKATYGALSAAYGYSSFGKVADIRDYGLGSTSYSYDTLGRCDEVLSSYFDAGAKFTLAYNSNGNLVSSTNPDGTNGIYWYDKEGRSQLAATMKNGAVISGLAYDYDSRGNRTQAANLNFVDDFSGTQISSSWNTSGGQDEWSISPDKTLKVDATIAADTVLRTNTSYTDGVFTSPIKMQANLNVGLIARCQDTNNLYMVRASGIDVDAQGRALIVIYKKTDGAWSLKASAITTAPAMNAWYTISVKTQGNYIGAAYSYTDPQGKKCSTLVSFTDTAGSWLSGSFGYISYPEGGENIHYFENATVSAIPTTYAYDAESQLVAVTDGDGDTTSYAFDANGNITQSTMPVYRDSFTPAVLNPVWSSSNMAPWALESGELSGQLSAAGESLLKANTDINDYAVQSKIKMISGQDVGLAVRVTSDTSYYLIRCSGEAGDSGTAIWKRTATDWNRMANFNFDPSVSQPSENNWYTLKVTVIGSTIYWQYQVNGVWSSTYQWTDASYATGGVGLRVASASGAKHYHFDDVAVSTTYSSTYDKANQLTQVKDSPGTILSTLTYDASGNTAFDGASYTYDERNRLTSVENAIGGSVVYTYDAMGRLLTRSTKNNYINDDLSQGAGSWIPNSTANWSLAMGLGNTVYKGNGLAAATASRKNTTAADYVFSAKLKITSTDATSATAGIVFRSDNPAPSVDGNEYYLGLYPGESKWKLFRVAAGSFGSAVASGTMPVSLNQYYTVSARAQGSQMRIFINGVEQNPTNPYTDSSFFTNTYVGLRARDAVAYFDDVRVIGLTNGNATTYRYSETSGDLINELDSNGLVTVTYVLDSSGNAIAVKRGTGTYYLHYNAHGDVTAITDASGTVQARYSYDSWGNPIEYNGASGASQAIGTFAGSPNQGLFLLFGGMLYDAAAGIYLTRTRAYNPKTGRFLQRDILDESAKDGYDGFPFGKDAIGTNLYAWCGNNPVSREDPSGMAWNFRSIGARYLGGVGAAIGSFIDYSIGYVSGYVGGGGYSGYGYSGGGYGYSGYRGGSKTKKAVQAAVKAKPALKLKGPSASAPSRDMVINNLRNLSVAGITPLKQPVLTNYSGMFGSEASVSPGGEAMLGGVTMMLGAERVYRGFTGAETSQQSVKKGVREVHGIEVLDGCHCLLESKNNIVFGGSLILVGAAMEVDASRRYFEDTVDEFKNKVGDWF